MSINPNQKPSQKNDRSSHSAKPSPTPMSQPNSAGRPPSVPAQPNQPPKQTENPWTEALKTIGLSLVLALGIRHFVAEARYIPSESMVPTLEVNDRLIVEKISYLFNPPQRGDIIVFMPPEAAGQACLGLTSPGGQIKDAFIKRVVGLPGEEVAVNNGQVYVNGQAIQESYISAPPNYQWGPPEMTITAVVAVIT